MKSQFEEMEAIKNKTKTNKKKRWVWRGKHPGGQVCQKYVKIKNWRFQNMIERMENRAGLDFTCFEKDHCGCCSKNRFQLRIAEEERPTRKPCLCFTRTMM